MKNIISRFCFILIFAAPVSVLGQTGQSALKAKILHTIDTFKGTVGVAVQGVDFKGGFVLNGDHKYTMMSVFKFPLALAVLHQVDQGKLSLTQKYHIPKSMLDTATWSPMLKDFPDQDLNITLADLLAYAVTKSDNNACDFLYEKIAGGMPAVERYIHSLGVKDIAIVYTEGEMATSWPLQYQNWCKPNAMAQLLQILYHQKALKKTTNDFLIGIMKEIPDWPNRITNLLPKGTPLIHKTGSSGMNKEGMFAATNDVGIVTLPNGKHLAIVVLVADYKGPRDRGEHLIAVISKQIWDYYTHTQ